jgi:hypothetical protein
MEVNGKRGGMTEEGRPRELGDREGFWRTSLTEWAPHCR